jgi:hypothetical protein
MKEKNLKILAKKIYYPGEVIFSNITIKNYHFVNILIGKNTDQLLIRPIEIYEFPHSNLKIKFKNNN